MSRSAQLLAFAERDPSNLLLLCDLLDVWLEEGHVDEAAARIATTSSSLRDTEAVRFREARCALIRRDFPYAESVLDGLVRRGADAVAVRHDLAYARFAQNDIPGALEALENVDTSAPECIATALLKARALFHTHRIDDALKVLSMHEGDGPHAAELFGLRALLLLDSGDAVHAGQQTHLALMLDPDQHEALLVDGTLALWQQRLDSATGIFRHVLEMFPESGRALLGLGLSLMPQGDIPAARAFLDRAAVVMPTHPGTWHALAWCQLLDGDLAGAKRSFEQALVADRTFGDTHGGLALVHALRGERAAAEDSLKRAIRLAPHSPTAHYAQSVLLLDEGRSDEALAAVEAVVQTTPYLPVTVTVDFIYRLRDTLRPRG